MSEQDSAGRVRYNVVRTPRGNTLVEDDQRYLNEAPLTRSQQLEMAQQSGSMSD